MVAALAHHLTAVLQSLCLPAFVTDVLPAGHLDKYQHAQLVTGVQKRRALGAVAGAHGVAAQIFFQDLGVQPLHTVRHGVALIGKALMPVQPPQLHPLAVQVQPAGHELHRAETKAGALFIQHTVGQAAGAGADEPQGQSVKGRVLKAPRVHTVQHTGNGQ